MYTNMGEWVPEKRYRENKHGFIVTSTGSDHHRIGRIFQIPTCMQCNTSRHLSTGLKDYFYLRDGKKETEINQDKMEEKNNTFLSP